MASSFAFAAKVGEYYPSQALPVYLSLRTNDLRAEGIYYAPPTVRVEPVCQMSQDVGVDYYSAELLQNAGHLALACADTSGESNYSHVSRRTETHGILAIGRNRVKVRGMGDIENPSTALLNDTSRLIHYFSRPGHEVFRLATREKLVGSHFQLVVGITATGVYLVQQPGRLFEDCQRRMLIL